MKKSVLLVLSLLFAFAAVSLAFAANGPTGNFDAKAGDAINVCGCGEKCECGTLAKKEGKCGCGKALVKATVNKVENGQVFYTLDAKEIFAPMTGKYVCVCEGCKCGSISQKPGKCACNKDMVKVKLSSKAK